MQSLLANLQTKNYDKPKTMGLSFELGKVILVLQTLIETQILIFTIQQQIGVLF